MRSPVAISNGCAPVLASYSAITLFTSSMSAVAGSYSRSVVSPREENVTTLAFMFGLLRRVFLLASCGRVAGEFLRSSCTVSRSCQDGIRCANEDGVVSSAQLLVVQEIRVSILCVGRIRENKIHGVLRSRVIDGRKRRFNGPALRTVNFLWKRSAARVNANSPRIIVRWHWSDEIDRSNIVVRNRCKNSSAGHASIAACPLLLNRNAGSDFRDCNFLDSVSAGVLCLRHPRLAR